jgi:pimeloyl-ACP methyl ester carboxylesterase
MNEPVLLLPGLMCDARLWAHQILALSRQRPVMVMGLHGATVEEMSQSVLAAAPAKFALVGQGLGGDVALDVTRRALDRVTRIAVISTDPLAETPQVAALRESRMVAARAGRLVQAMAEEYPANALAAGPGRAAVQARITEMAETLGEADFLRQSRALQRRPDQQKTLRRAALPALVIAGAEDTLVPLRRQEFVAGLMPFAKLAVIAGAGHLPPLEQPAAVTEALDTFLKGPMLLR